jgi:Family of unknown function (DUF6680)
MDLTNILMIAAIFLGPIVAVRLTRYLDDKKEVRERKVRIFKILMATRGAALSPAHVEALNMIDLEFSGTNKKEERIIDAWKLYFDHLSQKMTNDEQWGIKRLELLVNLLYEMANVLNFKFDKVQIKNAVYSPRGYGEIEDDQAAIRRGFRELLEGRRVVPMYVTNLPAPPSQPSESSAPGAKQP